MTRPAVEQPGPPLADEFVSDTPQTEGHTFLDQSFGELLACFCWSAARLLLFRFSPPPLHWWRRGLLRLFGATVHRAVRIAPSARIDFPWNFAAGPKVSIQHGVIINCMGPVKIASGTMISQYAHLCAGTHAYQEKGMRIERCPITVGSDVWIAADAFVGPGVTLGDRCLLAARSSAFHDLPEGQICVGEPAEPRRPRFEEE